MKMSSLDWVAVVLVIIGAVNWGLIGLFQFNLVDTIFGVGSAVARVVYVIVGLAGLWMIISAGKMGKES